MEQDHVAAVDAAVDVFVFVDDRVELAFAADRHQAEFAGAGAVQARAGRACAAARGRRAWRTAAVKRAAADLEFLFRAVDLGELLEAGNDVGDRLADLRGRTHARTNRVGKAEGGVRRSESVALSPVIRHSPFRAGCRASQTRLRRSLAMTSTRSRARVPSRAAVAQADVVEHRFLRRRLRLFVAGEHRQDDRLARQAVGVARVERRAQVRRAGRGCRAPRRRTWRRGSSRTDCRRGRSRLSARRRRRLRCRPSCRGRASSAAARRSAFCSRSKIASLSFGVTPTEPMPCTFEWPRIGISPQPGRPTMPRSRARLAIACTFLHAVGVVRDAHRPTEDDVLRRGVAARRSRRSRRARRRSWR